MSYNRGPYPDEHGFERWQDASPIFRRRFDDKLTAIVSFLPGGAGEDNVWGYNGGWGYVILIAGVVVNGKYDVDWSAEDAMLAAVAKVESRDPTPLARELVTELKDGDDE